MKNAVLGSVAFLVSAVAAAMDLQGVAIGDKLDANGVRKAFHQERPTGFEITCFGSIAGVRVEAGSKLSRCEGPVAIGDSIHGYVVVRADDEGKISKITLTVRRQHFKELLTELTKKLGDPSTICDKPWASEHGETFVEHCAVWERDGQYTMLREGQGFGDDTQSVAVMGLADRAT